VLTLNAVQISLLSISLSVLAQATWHHQNVLYDNADPQGGAMAAQSLTRLDRRHEQPACP